MIAANSHVPIVVEQNGGTVDAGEEHQGMIAKMCIQWQGGLSVFAVWFWHTEGWTPRNEDILEAVLKVSSARNPRDDSV